MSWDFRRYIRSSFETAPSSEAKLHSNADSLPILLMKFIFIHNPKKALLRFNWHSLRFCALEIENRTNLCTSHSSRRQFSCKFSLLDTVLNKQLRNFPKPFYFFYQFFKFSMLMLCAKQKFHAWQPRILPIEINWLATREIWILICISAELIDTFTNHLVPLTIIDGMESKCCIPMTRACRTNSLQVWINVWIEQFFFSVAKGDS
jgi:hypothetical protein